MSTLFLAQLLGAYFIIVGAIVLIRRNSFMPAVRDLAQNPALMIVFAAVELAAGLSIVLVNPEITWDWMGIISLIGWMMLVEGVVYLLLPQKRMRKFIGYFNKPHWYLAGGAGAIVIGGYLAAVGFGLTV